MFILDADRPICYGWDSVEFAQFFRPIGFSPRGVHRQYRLQRPNGTDGRGLVRLFREIGDSVSVVAGRCEQMAPETEQPYGICVLMWLSLLIGVWAILGEVVFFIHPLFLYQKYAFPETHAERVASFVFGLSFLPLFWGIRRRLAVAWTFGWFLLVVSFSWTLADVLESIRKQPDYGGWIALAAVTIAVSSVGAYWGRWWYRQKKYFSKAGF
jgi:hypothetical protein